MVHAELLATFVLCDWSVPVLVRSRGQGSGTCAPADALLVADAGAFLALSGEDVGMAGVGVAPAQIGVECPGLRGVVGVVRVSRW